MKDIAFVFLPCGVLLSVLLLSGVALFQRIAITFQKKSIRFQVRSKNVNVSISSIILFYTFARFLLTITELNKYTKDKMAYSENVSSLSFNRFYLKKIRLQRNFWILLLCFITWFFLIRFSHLLGYYRDKVKKLDEMYEAELSEKKELEKLKAKTQKEVHNKQQETEKEEQTEEQTKEQPEEQTKEQLEEQTKEQLEEQTIEQLEEQAIEQPEEQTDAEKDGPKEDRSSVLTDSDSRKAALRQRR